MFEVHAEDWGNQTQVVYNGRVYDIIRAFQKGLGVVELDLFRSGGVIWQKNTKTMWCCVDCGYTKQTTNTHGRLLMS